MGVDSIRFYERFPNEAVCYRYIADIKRLPVSFIKNVVMSIIVWVENHHHAAVRDGNMMRVRLPLPCPTSVNFHFILLFILHRSNHMDTIFDNLICRMVRYKPIRRLSDS